MKSQLKNIGFLFSGQIILKSSSFLKQLLLAFYLGVSGRVDLLIIAQIIPNIIGSVLSGGAGEIIASHKDILNHDRKVYITQFVFLIFILTFILLISYLFSIPLVTDLLDVRVQDIVIFERLAIFISFSKLFSSIVSCLQYIVYAKNYYKYSVFSIFLAELLGLLVVFLTINESEVLSFAYGLLVSAFVNALFFIFALKLPIFELFNFNNWLENYYKLLAALRKVFVLGLQTLINHLSTFWERSLSFKYLNQGYLSALNYSKSLAELPQMALLSSVLTTTYIEQNKRKSRNEIHYKIYSSRINNLLNKVSLYVQITSLIFAPLTVIIFYERGAFDKADISLTFSIYNLLLLGFMPGLILHFLSRIMFIESKNKALFWIIFSKSFLEIILMTSFISSFNNIIPLALTISKYFAIFILYFYLAKTVKNIFNHKLNLILFGFCILFSSLIYFFNSFIIKKMISLTFFELVKYYSPIILIFLIVSFFFVRSLINEIQNAKE